MNKTYSQNQYVKKAGTPSFYTKENVEDLVKSAKDVIYFIEKFIKIQHPTKGSVNFKLYDYQKELIKTFDAYKYVIALTGRQLGKCVAGETQIYYENNKKKIGDLIFKKLNFLEKTIYFLENNLIKLIQIEEKTETKEYNKFLNFLVFLIKLTLKILYRFENNKNLIENKFTHIENLNFQSKPYKAKRVFRTKPLECWLIKTEKNYLFASGEHILFDENNREIYLKECIPNKTYLKTIDGKEKVISVKNLNFKIHMYDLEIDHESHLYFTNNIASHNTTCACAYILWKAIFNEDLTILIAANKLSSALEIMSRIRYMYEELPEFIKPGVTVYNKSSIEFDNRSRIISRATTPDAGRGLSVSLLYCLDPETKVTVRNKETKKIEILTLRELFNRL